MKTRISHNFKSQIKKIFWITIAWTLISIYQFYAGYSALLDFDCDLGDAPVSIFFGRSVVVGILAGLVGGSGLVFLWEGWLRSKNYGSALLSIFWTYCLIYLFVSLGSGLYFHSYEMNQSVFSPSVWKRVLPHLFELDDMQSFITWLVVLLVTLIVLQVNDKYGPGVFGAFLRGRYFRPKREERIFMFLDLRASTTIAEKLGEEHYFNFIKDVFKDATPAILETKGEIYQYVGDEIIVSWEMEKGLENANCLQCFFLIQSTFQRQQQYYVTNYADIHPEFKAGLHYGHVMAGEIGVVKRDIAFSGDVLNTTARIQSKCNEMGVNILLSKFLLEKLPSIKDEYTTKNIGEIALRGKQHAISLFTAQLVSG